MCKSNSYSIYFKIAQPRTVLGMLGNCINIAFFFSLNLILNNINKCNEQILLILLQHLFQINI